MTDCPPLPLFRLPSPTSLSLLGAKDAKACSRCGKEWYCGKECQLAAWPFHKKECSNKAESQSSEGQDESRKIRDLRRAAEGDDAVAQRDLGACHLRGDGVEMDEKEAVKWLRKAAKQGDAMAQRDLGRCLLHVHGDGIKKDEKEGAKWMRKAAEQGDAIAQILLSKMQVSEQNHEDSDLCVPAVEGVCSKCGTPTSILPSCVF